LTGNIEEDNIPYQIDFIFKHYEQANTIKILTYNEISNEIDTNQIIAMRKD